VAQETEKPIRTHAERAIKSRSDFQRCVMIRRRFSVEPSAMAPETAEFIHIEAPLPSAPKHLHLECTVGNAPKQVVGKRLKARRWIYNRSLMPLCFISNKNKILGSVDCATDFFVHCGPSTQITSSTGGSRNAPVPGNECKNRLRRSCRVADRLPYAGQGGSR